MAIHANFNSDVPVEIPNFNTPLPVGRQKLRIVKVLSRDPSSKGDSINLNYLIGSPNKKGTSFLRLNFKAKYLTPYFIQSVAANNPVIPEADKTRARIVLSTIKKLMLWNGDEPVFTPPGWDDESLVGTEFEGTIVHSYLDDEGRHSKRMSKDGDIEYFLTERGSRQPEQVGPEDFDPESAQAEVRYIAAPPKAKKPEPEEEDDEDLSNAGEDVAEQLDTGVGAESD